MDIAKALIDILSADADIAAAMQGRIYSDKIPQSIEQLPAVVLYVATENAWTGLAGAQKIEQANIEIDTIGRNRSESTSWRLKIRDVLDAFRPGLVGSVWIRSISQQSGGAYETDRALLGSQEYRFVVMQYFTVTYCSEGT